MTTGAAAAPPRWRTTDPLILLVAAVSLLTFALKGVHGALTRDLGVYSYAGQQFADGVPPYLGILNRAGPLAHAIPGIGALVARLLGTDDLITMRVLFMLIATTCLCFVYVLGRDVFGSRLVGLVTASAFLTFQGFIQYAANGPREKTPMTLFIVVALWAVSRHRWFTAGVFVALATLCLQIAFFSVFPAVVAGALLLAERGRLRALFGIALGGAVPVAVCAAWFALAGSLRESVDAFFVINWTYTVPNPVMEDLDKVREDLEMAYGVTLWLMVAGLVALALRSLFVLWPRARRSDPAVTVLAAYSVGAAAGLAWNLKDYDAWPDLFPMLPFAAVGIGGAVALLLAHLPRRPAVAVTAVLAVACTALALQYSLTSRDDTLDAQRAAVRAVLAELPDDARITSIEGPQPLVLTGRTNPTRYQMFRGGLQDYLEDTWPGGRDAFARELVDDGPDLISTGEAVSLRWRRAIMPDYVFVGRAPEWEWYARASLGPEKIAALRQAAGYDPTDRYALLEDTAP